VSHIVCLGSFILLKTLIEIHC